MIQITAIWHQFSHLLFIYLDPQPDGCSIIHKIFGFHLQTAGLLLPAAGEISQHVPHCQLSVTLKHKCVAPIQNQLKKQQKNNLNTYLDIAHVSLNHSKPICVNQLPHQLAAPLIGRHLSPEV